MISTTPSVEASTARPGLFFSSSSRYVSPRSFISLLMKYHQKQVRIPNVMIPSPTPPV